MGPIDALPRPLAIAIHDAGAANMIVAWAAVAETPPERVWAQGPALSIWRDRLGPHALVASPEEALDGAATLLSGTGWASDLEHRARIEAKARGIRSVAVIDHWVNYAMRFERDGVNRWPDAAWVGDPEGAIEAARALPGLPVSVHDNLYLREQARAAGPVPETGDILFVSEPARSDWGGDRPGEIQALDHFEARRAALGIPADARMRLRPHPSDPRGKYDAWLAANADAALDRSPDIGTALADARWVVGLNSMALIVALAAGRRAISALPPHAPPCVLPHRAIERL